MARAHFRDVVFGVRTDGLLTPLADAVVEVFQTTTETPVEWVLYAAPTGPDALGNPLTSDPLGKVEFWLDTDERLDLRVSKEGFPTQSLTVDVESEATETGDEWLGGTVTGLEKLGIRSTGTGAFDVVPRNTDDLTAERTIDIPTEDADQVLVTETVTQTLTNKTLDLPTITDPTITGGDITARITDAGGQWFNPRAFGAEGDGVGGVGTNDTVAFQTCINAAVAANGGVFIPPGDYLISNTLTVSNVNGFTMIGASAFGATLRWIGDVDTIPLILIEDCQDALLMNFCIRAYSDDWYTARLSAIPAYPFPPEKSIPQGPPVSVEGQPTLGAGISIQNNAALTGIAPRCNNFINIRMQGDTKPGTPPDIPPPAASPADPGHVPPLPKLDRELVPAWRRSSRGIGSCFRIGSTDTADGTIDNDNDFCNFYACHLYNYATAAFEISDSQSKTHRIVGCMIQSNSFSQYGVLVNAGSFWWYGGGGGGHIQTDFHVLGLTDTVIINGANFESSARFLHTSGIGATGAPMPITLTGCRYAHAGYIHVNPASGIVPPDTAGTVGQAWWIFCGHPGPLIVQGCTVQDPAKTSPPSTVDPDNLKGGHDIRVRMAGIGPSSVSMTGNWIHTVGDQVLSNGSQTSMLLASNILVNNNVLPNVTMQAPIALEAAGTYAPLRAGITSPASQPLSIRSAAGGSVSDTTTGVGGVGGGITILAGTGGAAPSAATAATGGAGAPITITAGAGGAPTGTLNIGTNTGGRGGNLVLVAGAGGGASGGVGGTGAATTIGGDGGDVLLASGFRGQGASGVITHGQRGSIRLRIGGTANVEDALILGVAAVDTLVFAATVNVNPSLGNVKKLVATGNATLNATLGGAFASLGFGNQRMTFIIENDATSPRTITFGTNFRPTATVVGVVSRKAVIDFISDGVAWFEVSRSLNVPL